MTQLNSLKNWFGRHKATITAFSGGVDSSLVLYVSYMVLGKKGIGLISNSESLKSKDFQEAVQFCEKYGIQLEIIKTEEIQDPQYTANPVNRCFFCKNHLYEAMIDMVQKKYQGYTIINGTNFDDLGDYRPGIEASKLYNIQSPLAELKIRKPEVIAMANYLGLPNAFKPPSPCLSSRIPYGTAVTAQRLKKIEEAEFLLNQYGFHHVRVRYRGEMASIEVPEDQIPVLKTHLAPISLGIRSLGFKKVVIDEEGFVSGKLNRVIHE